MGCVNLVSISEYSSCTEANDITLLDSWVISAKDNSPRSLNCFHERSVTTSTDVL